MMVETRTRLAALGEWVIAAACVVAIAAGAGILARDYRGVRPVVPVMAGASTAPAVPALVPARAVSIPVLILPDGKSIEVGGNADEIGRMLGERAAVGVRAVERDGTAERTVQAYRYAGVEFVLVVANGKVFAIYR
jgi:hypothetical protein